jgi:orotidine-5'-phosphate decarboxylase
MTFLEKIRSAQARTNSKLCIGLDTDWRRVPDILKGEKNPVFAFNKAIIDATSDLACAYKPNTAYYEAFGEAGLSALAQTLEYIEDHIFTIGDCKRGDMGATSEQYHIAWQEEFYFDAITLSPYMGSDSVEPFLRSEEQGAFFLGLTSNPGARDFQYLELASGKKLYEQVTDTVREWNKAKKNCGLVVGATKPEELKAIRERAPELPFLIPGVGAQGGSLEESLKANGNGIAIINVSRGITAASSGKDFAEAARAAALKYVEVMRAL